MFLHLNELEHETCFFLDTHVADLNQFYVFYLHIIISPKTDAHLSFSDKKCPAYVCPSVYHKLVTFSISSKPLIYIVTKHTINAPLRS